MNILITIGVLLFISFGVVIILIFRGGSGGDEQPTTTANTTRHVNESPPSPVPQRPNTPETVEESLDTLEDFCGITEADRRQKVCSRLSRIHSVVNSNEMENSTKTTTKKGTQS